MTRPRFLRQVVLHVRQVVARLPQVRTDGILDSFVFDAEGGELAVEVEFLDQRFASFLVQYDSVDPKASVREGAFKAQGEPCGCSQTGQWRRVTFRIGGGRFANRCNGADLRFAVLGGDLAVTHVVARRAP